MTDPKDKDRSVRVVAAEAIGSSFSDLPDRDQAYADLHHLFQDEDSSVRWIAAGALCSSFSDLPDKDLAWADLHRLAQDDSGIVRSSANHSLGRASIQRANEAKDDDAFREEIERAIVFFEKAAKSPFTPSRFCLPFYRSFYAITFKKAEAEAEVKRYLKEAKSASQGQKSKEMLVEAIENLSRALLEVNRLEDSNMDLMKCDLKAYEQYCSQASELLALSEENAPGAVKALRRGFPIIDRRIKAVLREIEEKAAEFDRAARDTPLAVPGRRAFEKARGLGAVEYQYEAIRALKALLVQAIEDCSLFPPTIRDKECRKLKGAEKKGAEEMGMAISSAYGAMIAYAQATKDRAENEQKIMSKLEEIDFRVIRLGRLSASVATSSSEMVALLKEMKGQLASLASLGQNLEILQGSVNGLDQSLQSDLAKKDQAISEIAQYLEKIIKEMPSSDDKTDLLEKIDEFKGHKFWTIVNRAAALASIIGLFLTAYGML